MDSLKQFENNVMNYTLIIKSHDKILQYYSLMCECLQFLTVWRWFTWTFTKKAEIH